MGGRRGLEVKRVPGDQGVHGANLVAFFLFSLFSFLLSRSLLGQIYIVIVVRNTIGSVIREHVRRDGDDKMVKQIQQSQSQAKVIHERVLR